MKDGGIVSELEALVLRLREQGAVQISVTKGDTSLTATFAPALRQSNIPNVEENGKSEPVKEEDDLAYWSAN
jgi:hypothetical protein